MLDAYIIQAGFGNPLNLKQGTGGLLRGGILAGICGFTAIKLFGLIIGIGRLIRVD
jgi:hypothetical protein